MKAFHGSGASIDQFSYEFTDIGNDQLGSGFYFTTKFSEALGYATSRLNGAVKPGGMLDPTIHEVELSISNPMLNTLERSFSLADITEIIKRSPMLNDALANWGEIEFSGKDALIKEAATAYASRSPVLAIRTFNELSSDFYTGHTQAFFEAVREIFKYDGVVCHFDEYSHHVAWFPEQIQIVRNISLIEMEMEKSEALASDGSIIKDMLIYAEADNNSAEEIIHHWNDLSDLDSLPVKFYQSVAQVRSGPDTSIIAMKVLDASKLSAHEDGVLVSSNSAIVPIGIVNTAKHLKISFKN